MMKKTDLKKIYKNPQNRNLLNNIVGTIVIKGVAMFLNLFTMPAYIRYFQNNEILGVWFSLVSILNWILTFDLGIGNGLRNHLVPALHAKDVAKIKQLISSAYFMLGVVSLFLGGIGYFLIGKLNINVILNVSSQEIENRILVESVRIVFLGVILQFFLRIITSIFYAMQKTALPNLLTLISSISILFFVKTYKTDLVTSRLIALSIAQAVCVCLPLLVATIWTFTNKLKYAKPNIKMIDWKIGKQVVGLGGEFFVIQICLMLITSTNEILISYLAGPSYTVEYQVYNRIFYMIVTLFSLLTQPMWSAFSQANAEKNYLWMKSVYQKFKFLALLGSIGGIGLAIIFKPIVFIWLGKDSISVSIEYALCFAILMSVTIFINSATCIANGMNELRCQIIWTIVGAVAKIPVSFLLVRITDSWIGVVMANIIVLCPLLIMQSYNSDKRLKNKIELRN